MVLILVRFFVSGGSVHATHVFAGDTHVCVIVSGSEGTRCWGSNQYGQCGAPLQTNKVLAPGSADLALGVGERVHSMALSEAPSTIQHAAATDDGQVCLP